MTRRRSHKNPTQADEQSQKKELFVIVSEAASTRKVVEGAEKAIDAYMEDLILLGKEE